MAKSLPSSPNAFPAEVARYLSLEPGDVQDLVKKSKLPALKIPKKTRTVIRIPLRDFHAWLQGRTQNPTPHLAKYETFLADFDATRRHSRTDQGEADE
jgi:hypothetical protein